MFLMLCMTALSMTLVQAQERTYSGVVKGSDGQPVIGASVEVVGTTVGTSTGLDGDYTIKAKQGSKIKYSFLGTKSVTVTAGGSTTIDVTLEDDAQALDDVVVVAFGSAKKKDLTGSVSSIDSKLISSQSNSTLTKALEGSIPGIQVSSVDGQPGIDMGVRIRGIGTASQNNANALIVIDGVPNTNSSVLSTLNPKDVESITVLKDAASTALWGSRGANGVVMVTTKRGQQGKAKVTFEGKWGINMIGSNGSPDLMRDPADYYEMMWQGIYNSVRYGSQEQYTTNVNNPNMSHEQAALYASQHLFNSSGNQGADAKGFKANGLSNWMYYDVPGAHYDYTGSGTSASATMRDAYLIDPNTGRISSNARRLYNQDDWEDLLYKKAFRQEYNVSVSGATDKTDYYISGGYMEDPSYIVGSTFNRYNVRSNINTQVTKWLKAGINMAYSRRATQSPATRWGRNAGPAVQNAFLWANGYSPMASMYARDKDGNFVYQDGEKVVVDGPGVQYSPLDPSGGSVFGRYPVPSREAKYDVLYQLENDKDETIANDLNMRGYVEAKFLKDFTFTANLAVDETYNMRNRYSNGAHGAGVSVQGAMARVYSDYMNINSQQTLNWAHDYGKHHVDALIGHEYNWYRTTNMNYNATYGLIEGFNNPVNFLWYFNTGGSSIKGINIAGGEDRESLEGYFARANYVYDNKYYLTGSLRFDGSSKFRNVSDRWGTFWSIGGAWRISAEKWIQDATWLTDLKIRADYGVIGNQNGIGRYSGYQTWNYQATERKQPGSFQPAGWKLSQGGFANENLTWEKKQTVDAGLDFRLWDRFYGTIDWYQTITDEALWSAPVSYAMTGQKTLTMNSARMRTRGFELELGVDIIKTPDILWSFSVNGGTYNTTLLEVPDGTGSDAYNGNWTASIDKWEVQGAYVNGSPVMYLRGIGKPYYNLYMYKYGGVDPDSGMPLYASTVSKDNISALQQAKHVQGDIKEGNTVYTTDYSLATRQEFGDVTPDFIGGFSTSFTYKNFDIAATFAFQLGGKFYSISHSDWWYNPQGGEFGLGSAYLSQELKNNTWSPAGANANGTYTNTSAKFPMLFNYSTTGKVHGANIGGDESTKTDLALFSASYLNVKNITVGYNFPQKWMDKIGIGGIRVYASLDNFWMICKDGIDPRMSLTGGLDVGAMAYPYMRTCSLGVNVTF